MVAVVKAANGAFIDVNSTFERRMGYRREEVLGRRPVDIGMWPDLTTRSLVWSRLRSSLPINGMRLQFAGRDGRAASGRLTCELFEDAGEAYLLCLLAEDSAADQVALGAQSGSYQALFLAAAEGLYRSLPGGGFIDVNPAMASLLGFANPEALMQLGADAAAALYVDPSRRSELRRLIEADGSFSNQRSRVRRVDGQFIWVSENSRAIRDSQGRVSAYEGSAVEITQALAAEAALRESEALYKVLVDSCRDGVFLIQRGVILFCNQAMADILGLTRAQLAGRQYMELVHPEDAAAQSARRLQREGGSSDVQRYTIRVRHVLGHFVTVAVHADAVQYGGDIASSGLMRDITIENDRRQALEDAERRYRELFEGSPIGLFKTHVDGRILEVNNGLLAMLGYPNVEDMRAVTPSMAEVYLDPNERRQVLEDLARDGIIRDREVYLRTRSGGRLLGSVSAGVMRSSNGAPTEFAGSVIDVTRQRQMAEALARSEARYRTLVEHSQVGVFISNGRRYVYANRALTAMFGYDEATLFGLDFSQLVAPEQHIASAERLADLESGQQLPSEFESCYLRSDGTRFWVRVSCSAIRIDDAPHITGMVLDITRHREAERRLRFHATHDALTGLPNRLMFQEALEQRLAQARATDVYDFAVLFLDLDGFKLVNDSLGHAAGDLLLVTLADQMSTALAGDAMVARYGGDEFTILPLGPCDRERVVALARRVIQLFEAPFEIGEQLAYSSASIGIVEGRSEYRNPVQILRDADTAMYRAKAAGKAGFVLFDDSMHGDARLRFELERDLRSALRNGQFEVYFQPLVQLADARIVGCEALVRWRHPARGLLLPAEFLQVAEEMGLIAQLDGWVLQVACDQLVGWQMTYPDYADLRLNVNLDDRQMGSATLVDEVAMVLESSGVAPTCLSLEVTETVFRANRARTHATLAALKDLGVGLVVDDFGTGYSSLDSFASAPFDALKIDRSFILDMSTNHRHRAIVRTIVAFASDLGLTLTAEGVESAEQSELLQALGCRLGQGYMFAPPLPAAEFERLLASDRRDHL